MKKYFSIVLILFLLLSSCGGNTDTSPDNDENTEENINSDSSPNEECLSDENIMTLTSEISQITDKKSRKDFS